MLISHNIPIGNVRKLVPNYFDIEKYVLHFENLQFYLRLGRKLKKTHCLKPYVEFNKKRIKGKKIGGKDGEALCKLTNNAVYGKIMENMKNRIDAKLVSNKNDYFNWTSKPSYMSQEIFDNDLAAICKNKVTITLNKPAYVRMRILKLNRGLMYKLHLITLKINMVATEGCYSQTPTV